MATPPASRLPLWLPRSISRFAPRRHFRFRLTASAAAILLASACDPGGPTRPSVPPPKDTTAVPLGKPYLVHTGANLAAYPAEAISESLYVANAAPGAWRVSLISAPPGTYLSGNLITYRLPEGLSGPQAVHALAAKDSSFLESTWTITAYPVANRPPTIEPVAAPDWILAGTTFRTVIHASDPDGDPLRFSVGGAPTPGFVLHDSVVEWTPTAAQATQYPVYIQINVSDSHGHVNSATFGLMVLAFDPRPYAATLRPGRVWRIRGYTKTWPVQGTNPTDSTYLRRTVTILTTDSANGTFSFRVQDTLSGTRNGHKDTTYSAERREGYDFNPANLPGLVPFGWPRNADAAETTQFQIGDKSWTARREIRANTCLNAGGSKLGCGGGESIYAAGWGLVSLHSESTSHIGNQNSREDYAVWDISEP